MKDLYPDTFRIVLSGGTDPKSVMEAVNRGVVHRFYTKSWDNKVLRANMREAFRHCRLHSDDALAAPLIEGEFREVRLH